MFVRDDLYLLRAGSLDEHVLAAEEAAGAAVEAAVEAVPPLPTRIGVSGTTFEARQRALRTLQQYFNAVRSEPADTACSPREQCHAALGRIERYGMRFWGSLGLWTRRRSAVDALLR